MKHKYLILIVGPTAVGKTELCLQLAEKFDTQIFSCDSRQFYKELSIGTAKPTLAELDKVKHHFINSLSIAQPYSVGDFEKECIQAFVSFFQNKDIAIMTGGSGLFAKAITHGLDTFPSIPTTVRKQVNKDLEENGLDWIFEELKEKDPDYAKEVDAGNPQRVTRALEVIRTSGQTYSHFRKGKEVQRTFKIIKIGLDRPRANLYERINQRVDSMMSDGLIEEAKKVVEFKNNRALQTVGYKESFEHIEGNIDLECCVELIKRNTRRYAKRQLTWFKNQDNYKWFHPSEKKTVINYIEKTMNTIETN